MFSKEIEDRAKAHAIQQFPNESVGLVVNNTYIPCSNIHENPTQEFKVDASEYAQFVAEGSLQAVIHSHTLKKDTIYPYAYPGELDMQTQANFNIPFGISFTDGERCNDILYFGDTVNRQPLEGRFFIHGVQDCYSLIRDFYFEWKNIWIKDFPRNWSWWTKGETLYNSGFEDAGFIKIPVEDMDYGSVLLMAVTPETRRDKNPCHAGIYLGYKNNPTHKDNEIFLHHKCNGIPYDKSSVSARQSLHRYKKYIVHCLKYVGRGA